MFCKYRMVPSGHFLLSFLVISAGARSVRQSEPGDNDVFVGPDGLPNEYTDGYRKPQAPLAVAAAPPEAEMVPGSGAAAPAVEKMCCCNDVEPAHKFLCYNRHSHEIFPPPTKKSIKGAKSKDLVPFLTVLSECGKGSEKNTVMSHTGKKTPYKDEKKTIYVGTISDQSGAVAAFAMGDSSAKKKYPDYENATNKDLAHLHIEFQNVVYGPSHKGKDLPPDSIHGEKVCMHYHKTAEATVVSVDKTIQLGGSKDNTITFQTECKESVKCVEWKVAHACGWPGNTAYLLKRKGRTDGTCEAQEKSMVPWSSATYCPKNMFHNSGKNYKFCDCTQNAGSPPACTTGNVGCKNSRSCGIF